MRAGRPHERTHPRFPIGRLHARRFGQAARRLQSSASRLPAAANAPKISNWCGQAARSSEGTQDSQLEGLKAVRAGCPQQRMHPRLPSSELEGFKAVRAAAANAPKIPNWKASRWSDSTQDSQLAAPRRCGKAARSSECTQDSQLEGFKAVQACCPQQRRHPRFLIGRLPGGPIAPKIPSWQLQGGAGRLPAAANAPKIPNWKASKRCRHAARSSECTQDSQLDLQGGAGRLPAAASAPKIPNSKASRRLQGGAGRLPAAANAPKMQRMHPRFSIGRLQGSAGRLPAAANAPQTPVRPKIPNSKASRQRGHAAANEPKIPN